MGAKIFWDINLQYIGVKQWGWRSWWKCTPFLGKIILNIAYSCLLLLRRSKGPLIGSMFLAQLYTFYHQVRGMVYQLTLLWVQSRVQYPSPIYHQLCQKWSSNYKHTEAHIDNTLFQMNGCKHTSIHLDQPIIIQSPSASQSFSCDSRSCGLQLPHHSVTKVLLIVFLDFTIQTQFQIL